MANAVARSMYLMTCSLLMVLVLTMGLHASAGDRLTEQPATPSGESTARSPEGLTTRHSVTAVDMDDFGRTILGCFHPTAIYRGITNEAPYRKNDLDAMDGVIYFRGAFTDLPYTMAFTLFHREVGGESQIRIVLGEDTAIVPASHNCSLRSWTTI